MELTIRIAARDEKKSLEDLQWRASLVWESTAKRCLLTPLEHLEAGHTYVAARSGPILGSSVLARPDGDADLDGLIVEPAIWKHGAGRPRVEHAERLAASCGSEWL